MASEPATFLDGRITIDPEVCNGKPTIRGKRIAAQTILEFLGAGETAEEILRQYPSLDLDDIRACLQFAMDNGELDPAGTSLTPSLCISRRR